MPHFPADFEVGMEKSIASNTKKQRELENLRQFNIFRVRRN